MTKESQQQSNEISLKELLLNIKQWFKYLISKWIIVAIWCLVGGVLGFLYAITKKPVYIATTTFVLEDEKGTGGGIGNLAGLASIAGVDLGGGGGLFQSDNILELYKSRKMIERTLFTQVEINGKLELLINRYIDFNELRTNWNKNRELMKISFSPETIKKTSRLQDSIIKTIVADINKNNLLVSKYDKKTGIIQAEVRAVDEVFAKNFNHAIVRNVNDFYINTKTRKASNNVRILQHKTDSVRAVMNGAIFDAVVIADATPNLNPTKQVKRVAPVQKAQFSAETNKAVLAEMVKNLELTKLSLLKETPLIQVIDEPVYPLEKKYISNLKGIIFGAFLLGFLSLLVFGFKFYIKRLNF